MQRNHSCKLAVASLSLALLMSTTFAATIRVPSEQPTIQAGIDAVADGDTVLVAPGIYAGSENRDLDYAGKAITVMSENGPDVTVIDCGSGGRGFCFDSGETADSKLTGFTITGGVEEKGGGIYCEKSSPSIANCVISDNRTSYFYPVGYGAGLYFKTSTSSVTDCVISDNTAISWYHYGSGAGIYCYNSRITVTDCSVSGNQSEWERNGYGGGIYCKESSFKAYNCLVSENVASAYGGGIYCSASLLELENCLILWNSSMYKKGGGICYAGSFATVTNCTFFQNSATGYQGGGGGIRSSGSPMYIRNCILWGDAPAEIEYSGNPPVVDYSDVQGGWPGEGNIQEKPRFIYAIGFDCLLRPLSPCIDAGDPSIEDALYRIPRWPDWYPNEARSDMGAYGGPGNRGWLNWLD